jgi:phosphopantothenoylcysteine decarboxylase/phosphopantothenate--cysteine ligase
VTAGGTREAIDPVRFIGNNSSGKQGYAIAQAAIERGADVTLISANVGLQPIPGVRTIEVTSALEMLDALREEFPKTDILAMTAAIADARPLQEAEDKIKKSDYIKIDLIQNPDLLADIASLKGSQVIIAFAAETAHDAESAMHKLAHKGADLLYLNDVSKRDIFNSETTYGEIFNSRGSVAKVSQTTKDTLAHQLLDQALLQLG